MLTLKLIPVDDIVSNPEYAELRRGVIEMMSAIAAEKMRKEYQAEDDYELFGMPDGYDVISARDDFAGFVAGLKKSMISSNPDMYVYVTEDRDEVVGLCGYDINSSISMATGFDMINPKYRGMGLGTSILADRLHLAQDKLGIKTVQLRIKPDNEASLARLRRLEASGLLKELPGGMYVTYEVDTSEPQYWPGLMGISTHALDLFHGSTVLFDKPSNAKIKSGLTSSEYGVGFNTSDYGGDALEHCGATSGVPGVIYNYKYESFRLKNWLVLGEPVDHLKDRILEALDTQSAKRVFSDSQIERIQDALSGHDEEDSKDLDGFKLFTIMGGRNSKAVTDFLNSIGIEGMKSNAYHVFFNAQNVPEQKIYRVVGDFPEAREALARQEKTGKLHVDQPVKADGTIMGPRKSYLSEELSSAAWEIHRTGDHKLIAAFERFVDPLLRHHEYTTPGRSGFSIRDGFGHAVSRSLRGDPIDLSDHWSGANTFIRAFETLRDYGRRLDADSDVASDIEANAEALRSAILEYKGVQPGG